MRETYCTAGFQPCRCPLWVISDRGDPSHTSKHVRFAPKATFTQIKMGSTASCQGPIQVTSGVWFRPSPSRSR